MTTPTKIKKPRVLPGHSAPRDWKNDALFEEERRIADQAFHQSLFTIPEIPAWDSYSDRKPVHALPDKTLIGSLRHGELRIIQPIEVRFSTEDALTIADAPEFNETGFGDNRSEALVDLQFAIAELYFELKAEQHNLGSDLKTVWGKLSHASEHLEHKTA